MDPADRRRRNCESAERSRQRKVAENAQIRIDNERLIRENKQLLSEIESLKANIGCLKSVEPLPQELLEFKL